MFASALGRPIDSPEVQAVLDLLGPHVVRRLESSTSSYDPDTARTVAWDFPDAPPASRWAPTNLGVRDDTVVWLALASELVDGPAGGPQVWLELPDDSELIFRAEVANGEWPPAIIRRRGDLLFELDVPQGHWDGRYRFPLTPHQAERLQAEPALYREVWDGLFELCQGARHLDDPATLPGDAQSFIDAHCGRD